MVSGRHEIDGYRSHVCTVTEFSLQKLLFHCYVLCVYAYNWRTWCRKWSHRSWVGVFKNLLTLKSDGDHEVLSVKCCCFVWEPSRESHTLWTSPSEERARKKPAFAVQQLPGSVLSWCSFAPLGVLLLMKALKNEWYIITYIYFILSYNACPCHPYI